MKHRRFWVALVCGAALCLLTLGALAASKYPYDTQAADSVKLRKTASTSATVLATINKGDTVTVLGKSGKFYKLTYGDVTGYAMILYIDGVTDYPYDSVTSARVNMRRSASESGTLMRTIPKGATVSVLSVTSNGYAKVKYSSSTGYVSTQYLTLYLPTPTPQPTPTPNPNAMRYTELRAGATGAAVRALQEALAELGFYTADVDSKYGGKTTSAVTAFQAKNKIMETGVADPSMQLLLYEGKPRNSKGIKTAVKTLAPIDGVTAKLNSKGALVERIQSRLKYLGYYLGEITGVYNKATAQGVKDFQRKHSLKANGTADPATQSLLFGATALSSSIVLTPTPAPTAVPPSGTVREGDTGTDAKRLQQRLKELGYYSGKVDGKFGAASVKALIAFQEKNGLKGDGVCGAKTIEALYKVGVIYAVPTAAPVYADDMTLTEETTVIIMAGSTGNHVLRMQTRLTELGYYTSRLDGLCLEDDVTAIRAFQKANGLKVDGKAGFQTQSALYGDAAASSQNAAGAISMTTLRYGSEGTDVMALQNRLITLGFLTGEADGKYGAKTKAAVTAFQKANKLTRDGVAGAKTQALLFGDGAAASAVDTDTTLRVGVRSDDVKVMQEHLIALGFLKDKADGVFGTKTLLALIEFQKKNSLTADGIAGRKTLALINSGKAKDAQGATPGKPTADALPATGGIAASSVRYANWYTEVKKHCKQYPNVTVYDFTTGISWQLNIFSLGAHADAEPLTANDTANMNRAFGKTTWTPKAVWVLFSDGRVYMASTHNTPHDTSHIRNNDFNGHLCVHFPRTDEQVAAIGSYATSHQKAIDLGWEATQNRASMGY